MGDILLAVFPVFFAIAVGAGLKRTGFAPEAFWSDVTRIVYFVLFPALLVVTVANAEIAGSGLVGMVAAFLGAAFLNGALLQFGRQKLQPYVPLAGPVFSSVFQGSVRWNAFVALAIVLPLLGPEGKALLAVMIGTTVPLLNVLCIVVLTRNRQLGVDESPPGAVEILGVLARNPLIIACALGGTFNALGGLPGGITQGLELVGRAALPLGLLAIGAGLNFEAIDRARKAVALSVVLKLLVGPLVAALICLAFGVEGTARTVAIIGCAVPTAASSYILARQLGGDSVLMAGIITAQTLAALLTLPVMLALLT